MMRYDRHAVLAAVFALVACAESPTDPDDDPEIVVCETHVTSRGSAFNLASAQPPLLPVCGLGAVTERYTAELAVRGDYAYTSSWGFREASGDLVRVWNIADDRPVLRDSVRVQGAGTTGDVQISDDGSLLVVAKEYTPGGLAIFSLANPERPQLINYYQSPLFGSGVHTVKLARINGRHYAFASINSYQSRPQLVIVDITNPQNPTDVKTLVIGAPYVHDVFVRDGWLFTAEWHDGVGIWDIGGMGRGGSVQNPVRVGRLVTVDGYVHNIWWFHDPTNGSRRYAFVGEEGPGGVSGATSSGDIHVVDVSDPANPREVAFYHVPGAGTHNFSMDEESGILYAAYYNGGVRALDVRGDLSACTDAQRAPDGRCDLVQMGREVAVALVDAETYVWGVQWIDGAIYATDMERGLYKIDGVSLLRD